MIATDAPRPQTRLPICVKVVVNSVKSCKNKGPTARGDYALRLVVSLRAKRLIVTLAILAVAPIVPVCFIDRQGWTSQWPEIGVAMGWCAPRYPWVEELPQGSTAEHDRPNTLDGFFLDTGGGDAARAAHLHGAWLVRRERWNLFTADPIALILYPRVSRDGRQFFADNWDFGRFAAKLRSALDELPLDVLWQADLMSNQVHFSSTVPVWVSAEKAKEHQRSRADDQPEGARLSSDVELWSRLVDAGVVLHTSSTLNYKHGIMWVQAGNVPGMQAWTTLANSSEIRETEKTAYAAALQMIGESSPVEFLETPLDRRLQQAWETLGLESRAARCFAENDRSASSQAVAWNCALHLELAEKFFASAMNDQDLEEAARWVELQENVAIVLSKSVRSPWLFNYVHRKHAGAGSLAQIVQASDQCPAAVAERMATIVARSPTPTPRMISGQSQLVVAAFYLDNIARSGLRVAVLTLTVAMIGSIHLRRRCSSMELLASSGVSVPSSLLVSVAAVVLVAAVGVGLEATNSLGARMWRLCYTVTAGTFLSALACYLWWSVLSELRRSQKPTPHNFRQRIRWLIGCVAVLALLRFLVSIGKPTEPFSALDLLSRHGGLPPLLSLLFGILLPGLMITYAVLRWRRWQREPASPPALHPIIVGILGAWIGLWITLGPPSEVWHFGLYSADQSGDFSPVREAVEMVGAMLQGQVLGPPQYAYGLNLLTISLALRTSNLGVWLVVVCAALWSLMVLRPKWAVLAAGSTTTVRAANVPDSRWLAGVSWSCLWLGLASLLAHGWCTLGLCYCGVGLRGE